MGGPRTSAERPSREQGWLLCSPREGSPRLIGEGGRWKGPEQGGPGALDTVGGTEGCWCCPCPQSPGVGSLPPAGLCRHPALQPPLPGSGVPVPLFRSMQIAVTLTPMYVGGPEMQVRSVSPAPGARVAGRPQLHREFALMGVRSHLEQMRSRCWNPGPRLGGAGVTGGSMGRGQWCGEQPGSSAAPWSPVQRWAGGDGDGAAGNNWPHKEIPSGPGSWRGRWTVPTVSPPGPPLSLPWRAALGRLTSRVNSSAAVATCLLPVSGGGGRGGEGAWRWVP